MTEQEWLACESLDCLLSIPDRRKSARKSRLALCACVRSRAVWPLLTSRSSRRAVEVSEAFADGSTGKRELGLAQKGALMAAERLRAGQPLGSAAAHLADSLSYQDSTLLRYGVHNFVYTVKSAGFAIPAQLVRDVYANPFGVRVAVSAAWRTPDVVSLAQAAYEQRTLPAGTLEPARLALLADALEDAGCDNADLLGHLRSDGPHVRGCWAVDLVLGRE